MDTQNPPVSTVGNDDLEATAQKAGALAQADYHMVNLRKVSQNATGIHPEPVHEPLPPTEVFYHKTEMDDAFDPHKS